MAVFTFTFIMLGYLFKALFYIIYGICMAVFYVASFAVMFARDIYRGYVARKQRGY